MAFEFLKSNEVEVTRNINGVLVGTITKDPEWMAVNKYGGTYHSFSAVGAIAVQADSVYQLMQMVEVVYDEKNPIEDYKAYERPKMRGFNHFETWSDCVNTFKNDPHSLNQFDKNENQLRQSNAIGKDVKYDVVGTWIDMGRFVEGDPECWGDFEMGNPNNLFATIVVSMSVNASVSASTLIERGKRLNRLVDWFESQGISTEVIAFNFNECAYIECVVKRFEDTLNLDLISVISNPDFFRRILFRIKALSNTWKPGYGSERRIANKDFNVPPNNRGFLVWTENQHNAYEVMTNFDRLEKELTIEIEEGNTSVTKVI